MRAPLLSSGLVVRGVSVVYMRGMRALVLAYPIVMHPKMILGLSVPARRGILGDCGAEIYSAESRRDWDWRARVSLLSMAVRWGGTEVKTKKVAMIFTYLFEQAQLFHHGPQSASGSCAPRRDAIYAIAKL